MDHPKGASSQRADRLDFDRRVRLEFRGAQISLDSGLLVMRELDDALGLSGWCPRRYVIPDAARTRSIVLTGCSGNRCLGGYEDVNDADRLAVDPVMR